MVGLLNLPKKIFADGTEIFFGLNNKFINKNNPGAGKLINLRFIGFFF